MATLKTICQNAAKEIGFPSPSKIVGSTDETALQLLQAAKRESTNLAYGSVFLGRNLAVGPHDWSAMVKESSITLVASDQDYALASDFKHMIPGTCWDRTDKRPVIFQLTSKEWQNIKGWTTTSSLSRRARIRAGELEFVDTIGSGDAGNEIYYEYVTTNYCTDSGGTGLSEWTSDTDLTVLDADLQTMGIIWRFLRMKGLPYEEYKMEYVEYRKSLISKDKPARVLDLNDSLAREYLYWNVDDRSFPSS